MNLPETMAALTGRALTESERDSLYRFEKQFEINEDDPLIIVLAMMAKNQLTAEQLPDLLQQKTKEIIEVHAQTLREQSTLIAKELVVTVGNIIATSAGGHKLRVTQYAGLFMAGFILGGLCVKLFLH